MNIILQQMLKQIIISFLLITSSFSIGTLTQNNCPLNFNPQSSNSTLATSNQNLAVSLYQNLFSSETQIKIQDSINQGDLNSLINIVTSTSFLLPYILIAVFFGLLFCTTICCCTFDRRCPPCESWRRNYVKQPYSKCQLTSVMIATLVFSIGILVTTIVAFSTFSTLSQDLAMIKCGLYYSLDTAQNGNQAESWGGLSQIQTQLQSVTGLLNGTATSINSILLGNQWIITGLQTLNDMNLALWTNNLNSVVLTPDPAATKSAMQAGTAIPTIVPQFIQQGLGPNGTAGTMISDIDAGFQITQKLSNQAYTTYMSTISLANSAQSIITNTNSNLQSITVSSSYLSNIQVSISNFKSQFLNMASTIGIYAIEGTFGIILFSSILSVLGIISTFLFKLLNCRKVVTGGWVIFGFIYFAILIILVILLAAGGLSYNFCQYFGTVIGSSHGYVAFTQSSKPSSFNKFFNYLDVCFFGDGNILKKFYVSSQMSTVFNMLQNTQTYINMQTQGNNQYIDITIAPGKILQWMNNMNLYGSGVYVDAASTNTLQSNPYVALSHMNLYSNQNSAGVNTTCANDFWVFDNTNCTYNATQSIYIPQASSSYGQYIPPTGTFCISLNTRISQSAPSIWTASDIAQRYLNLRQCKINSSDAYDMIIQYAQSITNYRDSRINLYKSLYDQLNSLSSVANTYNANLTSFTSKLNTFYSSVSPLSNIVTNQLNGLTISANCTVIADSVRFFYNMYCVNFLYRTVKIGICCVILLVLIICSIISGSIFAVRFSRVEKLKRLQGTDSQIQIFKTESMEDNNQDSEDSSQQKQ